MSKRTFSGIILILLLASMSTFVFNTQPVEASGTIYIRADGSIDPPSANITSLDNVTYTLTGDITIDTQNYGIVVERDNIVINGAGYTVQGTENSIGISLESRSNVTVKNMNIESFYAGIRLHRSSNNNISGITMTNNTSSISMLSCSYNSISENDIANNQRGIELSDSSKNTINGNNITANNGAGIRLEISPNNTIVGNIFANDGLVVWYSYGNVVEDNVVNGRPLVYLEKVSDYTVGDAGQVILLNCTNIQVQNFTISNTSIGMQLWGTTSSSIDGNNITNNMGGIWFMESSNNTIVGNNITANKSLGIILFSSSNNTIVGNNITNNIYGIYLQLSDYNSIRENSVTNNFDGIYLHFSSKNTVVGNNITNNMYGIRLARSSNNTIVENVFANDGLVVWYSYGNVVEDNVVNGRPLVYLEKVSDYTVGDAGLVILMNCTNVRVENLTISSTSIGIQLCETTNSSIDGNNITNNQYGIRLGDSSNNSITGNNITANVNGGISFYASDHNTVSGNNISANNKDGINLGVSEYDLLYENVRFLRYSNHNTVTGNNVTANNRYGIRIFWYSNYNTVTGNNVTANNEGGINLSGSSNNTIARNNVTANVNDGINLELSDYNSIVENSVTNNFDGIQFGNSSKNTINGNDITANNVYGINLFSSGENVFFHNNLINNTRQVNFDGESGQNTWDNGFEGNYWSNYNGSDLDGDGVGDTELPWEGVDNYPLMNVFWNPCDINHDLAVDMKDVDSAVEAFGSEPGDPLWNPHADITGSEHLAPDSKVEMRDIGLIARNFGISWPDSNMILLTTSMGDIKIELYGDMPITAGNFKNLVQQGVYDGTIFHRVIDGFMIQGGDPTGTGQGDPSIPSIPDEFTDHNRNDRGTIAMANAGPNTGSSQFFINLVDNNYLDEKHPVFGRVVEGMSVVDSIGKVETDENDRPLQDVILVRAELVT